MNQIVILGAGISGLATAWFLKQELDSAVNIHILEKSDRAGGWIQTLHQEGFLFEQGPHSCRSKGTGQETLALIEALGLQDQVVVPHSDACIRYLYDRQSLKRLPKHIWEIPFNSLTKRGWIKAFWNDWRMEKREEEDESIHHFFSRRLGKEWADRLIDPFVLGIYAGDSTCLSMKSCFPLFDEWEQKRGSLLRGAWHHKSFPIVQSSFVKSLQRFPLFSFQEGMETLPKVLAEELKDHLILQQEVKRLDFYPSKIEVQLQNGNRIQADYLISTLPTFSLGSLISSYSLLERKLKSLHYATVVIVNVGFDASVLPFKGFGYLVPTKIGQIVLGAVWDSCIFPQQNGQGTQTRITIMMGGSCHPEVEQMTENEAIDHALNALKRQMGIRANPNILQVKKARKAIPQYEVGYQQWKKECQEQVYRLSDRLILSGSGWSGVSINDCIAHARRLTQQIVSQMIG